MGVAFRFVFGIDLRGTRNDFAVKGFALETGGDAAEGIDGVGDLLGGPAVTAERVAVAQDEHFLLERLDELQDARWRERDVEKDAFEAVHCPLPCSPCGRGEWYMMGWGWANKVLRWPNPRGLGFS